MSETHSTYLPNLSSLSERPFNGSSSSFWETSMQPWPVAFQVPHLWTGDSDILDYIKLHYGTRRVASMRGSYGLVVRPNHKSAMEGLDQVTLGEFIDRYRAGEKGLPYLTHMSILRNFPEMLPLLQLPAAFSDNWIDGRYFERLPVPVRDFMNDLGGAELFIGQAGHGFGPVHVDFMAVHVLFVQLKGRKRFILFPPSDGKYLYPTRGRMFPFQLHYTQVDVLDPELLERWPLVAKASPISVVLEAGDCLVLPAHWWHTTVNETDGMTYCGRVMNRTNASLLAKECVLGIPRTALKLLGK